MKLFDYKYYIKDNLPTEEDTSGNNGEDTQSDDDTDNETNDGSIPRIIYDNSESEQGQRNIQIIIFKIFLHRTL